MEKKERSSKVECKAVFIQDKSYGPIDKVILVVETDESGIDVSPGCTYLPFSELALSVLFWW
jgi:hypothetical protein